MDTQRFLDRLSAYHPLSADCRNYFSQIIKEEHYRKNEVILSPGQTANKLWFVEKGFVMQYSYREFDKKPYRFWQENEVIINTPGFFGQVPSDVYIEIQESTTLLAIRYEEMQLMYDRFPEIHRLSLMIIEEYHDYAERRAMDLLTLSAEDRYEQLLEDLPCLPKKVSMDYIAAYLGVSRKTFSRIRIRQNSRPQC